MKYAVVFAVSAFAFATPALADFLYFTDVRSPTFADGRIQRIRTDGSELTTLAELDGGLRSIVVNEAAEEIIWSNVHSDVIRDQGSEPIVSKGLEFPRGLSLAPGDRLVWIDSILNSINSASIDGSDRVTLLTEVFGGALEVDSTVEKIFFENRHNKARGRGEIRRMNLDGSEVETIIDDVPTATSIAIDSASETIFWGSSAGLKGGDGGLYRVNFDGTGFEEIFLRGDNLDTGALAIDEDNRVLYFSQATSINRDAIFRIGLDGSNPTMIADGFGAIADMVLSSVEIGAFVPELVPEPSSVSSGCTGILLLMSISLVRRRREVR